MIVGRHAALPGEQLVASFSTSLPIDDALPALRAALAARASAVLEAPPGAPPMTTENVKRMLEEFP